MNFLWALVISGAVNLFLLLLDYYNSMTHLDEDDPWNWSYVKACLAINVTALFVLLVLHQWWGLLGWAVGAPVGAILTLISIGFVHNRLEANRQRKIARGQLS